MKSLLLFLITAILFLSSCSSNDHFVRIQELEKTYLEKLDDDTGHRVNRYKLLLFPFIDLTSQNNYPYSSVMNTIFFHSLYSYVEIFPDIDVPEKATLQKMGTSLSNFSELSESENADFIISGDYKLSGPQINPVVAINLYTWNKINQTVITNSFKTPTDLKIFDTLDQMLSKIVRNVLKQDFNLAYLNISAVPNPDHDIKLYVNDRLIDILNNTNAATALKVLSGTNYDIRMNNSPDGLLLLKTSIVLDRDEMTNITYHPSNIALLDFKRSQKMEKNFPLEWFKNIERYERPFISANYSFNDNVDLSFSGSVTKTGKRSLSVKARSFLGTSVFYVPAPGKNDWTGMNYIKFWMYNQPKKNDYIMVSILDNQLKEFVYFVHADWEGWKQLKIPIKRFKRMVDRNFLPGKIEFPVLAFTFFKSTIDWGLTGYYQYYFDRFEVVSD